MAIRRVYPGQAVKADDINAARRAGETARLGGVSGASFSQNNFGTSINVSTPSTAGTFSIKCRARNIDAAAIPARGCVEICGSEIAARGQNSAGIVVDIALPGHEDGIGLYGILTETVKAGKIGQCVVLGFAMGIVNGDMEGVTQVGPVDGEYVCESGAANFNLIWCAEGEEERMALLLLGGGGGGAEIWEHVDEFPEIAGDRIVWFDPEGQPWGASETAGDTHWYPMWKFTSKTGVPGTS